MKLTDIPAKQPVPFGINGQREPLLSTTPPGDNTASYNNGFPAVTMILKSAGGLPPKGQDMNQVLFELSSLCRWFSAGGAIPFDADFCASIGGYPKGARIVGGGGSTIYISTVDSNTVNPNLSEVGWLNTAKLTSIASLSGGANKLPYFTSASSASQTDITQLGRDILSKETIQDLFSYLSLGTASGRDVGTSTSQIPDMSSFLSSLVSNGYQRLPGGLIIQWGSVTANPSGVDVTFPIAFPNSFIKMIVSPSNAGATSQVSSGNFSSTSATIYSSISLANVSWLSIGR